MQMGIKIVYIDMLLVLTKILRGESGYHIYQ